MDYATIPMTRQEARKLAKIFRTLFDYNEDEPFNPIDELDNIHNIFKNVDYIVIEDDELPVNVPAACEMTVEGNFLIKIKETVFLVAVKNKIGGYLMDITHEMVHAFLYKMGYVPLMNRSFKNNTIPAYMSAEWQVKAVAGEIMIPYEATKNKSETEIMKKYNVSKSAATIRKKLQ